jgi:hypothetical protein
MDNKLIKVRKFICLNCQKEFESYGERKFCNKSCSASYNNIGIRRNGEAPGNCKICNKILKGSLYKFCDKKCEKIYKQNIIEEKIKLGIISDKDTLKRYLKRTRKLQCEICGIKEWNNQPVPLTMDHINGHSENNNLDNLRLICPNCDALLPTFAGRNRGNGRVYRRLRYAEGKSS